MVAENKRKQDKLQAFFTTCPHIAGYMIDLLNLEEGLSILEPCAGEGAFVDAIINSGIEVKIDALELSSESINKLNIKYRNKKNITIEEDDFILTNKKKYYDRVIANPPYGAYQTHERRNILKCIYPDIYAKETYAVFLVKALDMLKDNGRLTFIIPDTFMTLNLHQGLRRYIISNFIINSISLFPSKFFPGINFGYAGLSIISISKIPPKNTWSFPIFKGFKEPSDLTLSLSNNVKHVETHTLNYDDIKKNHGYAFYISEKWVHTLFARTKVTINDISSVVTGFYSGNDVKHLRRHPETTKGEKKYNKVKPSEIYSTSLGVPPLNGLSDNKHWVPIVKGGNTRFFKKSEWYMDWSVKSVNGYKFTNKKARFQNSQFYFKQGIAVPMVSSKCITGALIDNRLFDQSIVGIFPKKEYMHLLMFLLGFFNTKICNKLIRTINASTNNSANYIKKIPIIIPELNIVNEISHIVSSIYTNAQTTTISDDNLLVLNDMFFKIYDTPPF